MRPWGLAGEVVVLGFGQVVAGGITSCGTQRGMGERLSIVRGEYPEKHTGVGTAVHEESHGVYRGPGLPQDLVGLGGVPVPQQRDMRSSNRVCADVGRERGGPCKGAVCVRVSTQYKVGLPEVSEGQMAARVKLCGPGLVAHRLRPATLAAVDGADHPDRVRVVRLPSPDPGKLLQRVIIVPAAVVVVVTEREVGLDELGADLLRAVQC